MQRDFGALAGKGPDGNTSSEGLDVAPHHIHSDPTPRNVTNLIRGRKAGQEDEIVDLIVCEIIVRSNQTPIDSLF